MLIWDCITRYMRKKLKSNQLENDGLFVFLMICIMAIPLVFIILTFIIVIRDGFLFMIFFLSMIISAFAISAYKSLKNKSSKNLH